MIRKVQVQCTDHRHNTQDYVHRIKGLRINMVCIDGVVYPIRVITFCFNRFQPVSRANHIIQNHSVHCSSDRLRSVEKSKRIDFSPVRIYDTGVSSLRVLKFNFAGCCRGLNLFVCTLDLVVNKIYKAPAIKL